MSGLWLLAGSPSESPYAHAGFDYSRVFPVTEVQPNCGHGDPERISPLVFTWEDSSGQIGDFSWPGCALAIISDRVVQVLHANNVCGFRIAPAYAEISRPRRRGGTYPATKGEPPLHELLVDRVVDWDRSLSTMRQTEKCDSCGRGRFIPEGVETSRTRAKRTLGGWKLTVERVSRESGRGVFVHGGDVGGSGLFGITDFRWNLYCDDRTRSIIERAGLTNVWFKEWGDILE